MRAGRRHARELDNVMEFGRELRAASELDSVMEFGLRHAHDVHTQVFVQLLAAHEPARELVADLLVSRSQAA